MRVGGNNAFSIPEEWPSETEMTPSRNPVSFLSGGKVSYTSVLAFPSRPSHPQISKAKDNMVK